MIDIQPEGLINAGYEMKDINSMLKMYNQHILNVVNDLSVYFSSAEDEDLKMLCRRLTEIENSLEYQAALILKLSEAAWDIERLYRNTEERIMDNIDSNSIGTREVHMKEINIENEINFLSQWY